MTTLDALPDPGERRVAVHATAAGARAVRGGDPWLFDGSISRAGDGSAGRIGDPAANVKSLADVAVLPEYGPARRLVGGTRGKCRHGQRQHGHGKMSSQHSSIPSVSDGPGSDSPGLIARDGWRPAALLTVLLETVGRWSWARRQGRKRGAQLVVHIDVERGQGRR